MDAGTLSNLLTWSLQALALTIVGGPLPWLLRLHDAAARHAYWRALLLACLVLPLLQPWEQMSIAAVPAAGDLTLLTGAAPDGGALAGITTTVVASLRAGRWPAVLTALLAAGAAFRFAWLAAGLVRLRRLRRASGRYGLEQIPEAGDVPCRCRYADGLSQPVTFGLLRPVILLPRRLAHAPEPLRRAVLEHELWHVRRRDWLWVIAEECLRALLWFHPAILWLIARVQASREEVVDELTVRSTNARREYLQALLAFANEAPLFPAAPFARRRHLFHRMLLISREVMMSPTRIVGTCAAMAAIVVACGAWTTAAFPLRAAVPSGASQQPRDFRPGEARPATQAEIDLRAQVTATPSLEGYLELARLQEARGALAEAEATLIEAAAALPDGGGATMELGELYQRLGRHDKALTLIEQAAAAAPADARAQHLAATFYEEIVRKTPQLDPTSRSRYVQAGIAAADRALALEPDYPDALVIKSILLRHQAAGTADRAEQGQLIAEADQLRQRALELRQADSAMLMRKAQAGMPPPPPPPPPPPGAERLESKMRRSSAFEGITVDGVAPVHVGGDVRPPAKIRDVRPIYPPEAKDQGVQGVVILEAVIDGAGLVRDTKVLRSIPQLDQAAVDAVQQWQFTPTMLNGAPVPVVMTVTINFTLQ